MSIRNHSLSSASQKSRIFKRIKSVLRLHLPVIPVIVMVFSFHSFTSPGQPMVSTDIPHHHKTSIGQCDNFIKIEGSTNINHFHFEQVFTNKEHIIEAQKNAGEVIRLKIPARDFKPSNPMMYNDFLELIKASEYPYINITIFMDETRLPAGPEKIVIPKIRVGLAGETSTYEIPGETHKCKTNATHIQGKIKINLQDFNLEPPTKFMGMVKVNNEVFINFGLTLNR